MKSYALAHTCSKEELEQHVEELVCDLVCDCLTNILRRLLYTASETVQRSPSIDSCSELELYTRTSILDQRNVA